MADAPAGIVPFEQFVQSLRSAQPEHHLNVPNSMIANEQSFAEMRTHLADYYDGVDSKHSFVDANGSIFDCIPIAHQFSLRGKSGDLPKAPDLPSSDGARGVRSSSPAHQVTQLHASMKDVHGNQMLAPKGTVAVRRQTLEGLARFKNLREFYQKAPGGSGGGRPPNADNKAAAMVAATHRWAHAYRNVDNLGGGSFINVWDPAIGANQIFSLAQHWYVGGSGAGLQTAEVGWQVYPQLYGNTKPVFFIYWTPDNYQSGCYNLSCSAFVQTNSNWAIGGALSPWSVSGGQQYELDVAFYLFQGRWWLYAGGEAAANAVGYYPASIYKNGAMAAHASEIDYGGETVGTTSWPPMGGGAFASAGWQRAAYQRQIHYFPTAGGRADAALTASAASPQCYTASLSNYNAPWNRTLWFGGPGGNNC
jgi:Neprosin